MARHTLARSLHDVGLATWFGGSLMGAVGLNGAAASLRNPDERSPAATFGWSRWAPVNAAAIGAHLIGAVQLLRTEQGRIRRQQGVARSSAVKTVLTVAALGTTAYSGVLNRHMAAAGHVPVAGATEPAASSPAAVAGTQKQLKAVHWLIPSLTGALVAVAAWQSEQMRPRQVLLGSLPSLPALPASLPKLAGVTTGAGAGVLLLSRAVKARRATSQTSTPASTSTSPAPFGTAATPSTPSGRGRITRAVQARRSSKDQTSQSASTPADIPTSHATAGTAATPSTPSGRGRITRAVQARRSKDRSIEPAAPVGPVLSDAGAIPSALPGRDPVLPEGVTITSPTTPR